MITPDLAAPLSPPAARTPTVLSQSIKDKVTLYKAYMPFLTQGGLFVASAKKHELGDEIYLILTLFDDAGKYPIAGKVTWITPAGASAGKPAGIGIRFPDDDSGKRVRRRIEELLGADISLAQPTHTL